MSLNTTSTLSPLEHSYYHRKFLEAAEKKLKLKPLALMKEHPKGMGLDSFVARLGHVAPKTTPVVEGTTPTSSNIKANKYTVTIDQYADWLPFSDKLVKSAINPIIEDTAERLGYAAGLSMDTIIRDHIIANATALITYAQGAANDNAITANMKIVLADVAPACANLEDQDAPTYDDDNYVWVIHPRNKYDIITDTSANGFIALSSYREDLESPLKGEIGQGYGARIVVSSNMTKVANAGTVNVYRTLLFAKDAFVMTKWNKDAVEVIIESTESGGIANPCHLVGTVAYKMEFGVKYVGGTFSGANDASPDLAAQVRGAATGG